LGEGKGKIHIHEVICDGNDDDDVWRIEALSKTNLIGVRRALRRGNACGRGDHDDICQWNGTLNTLISWIGCIRVGDAVNVGGKVKRVGEEREKEGR